MPPRPPGRRAAQGRRAAAAMVMCRRCMAGSQRIRRREVAAPVGPASDLWGPAGDGHDAARPRRDRRQRVNWHGVGAKSQHTRSRSVTSRSAGCPACCEPAPRRDRRCLLVVGILAAVLVGALVLGGVATRDRRARRPSTRRGPRRACCRARMRDVYPRVFAPPSIRGRPNPAHLERRSTSRSVGASRGTARRNGARGRRRDVPGRRRSRRCAPRRRPRRDLARAARARRRRRDSRGRARRRRGAWRLGARRRR